MTRQEHLKFCSICNHRQMDMKQGLLCELTQAKADFEDKCKDFEVDQKAVENEMMIAREKGESYFNTEEREEESSENPNMKGTSWLQTIGVCSLINIIIEFFGVRFIIGLGITSIVSAVLGYLGIGIAVFVSIMYIVLSYIAKHEEAEWAYRLGLISYAVDTVLVAMLCVIDTEVIVEGLFHIIVLIILCTKHFVFSKEIRQKAKAEKWSISRIVVSIIMSLIIVGSLSLCALIFVGTLVS